MPRPPLLALVAALAVAAPLAAARAQDATGASEARFRATTLDVQAEGVAHVAPDMATVTLGVSSEAPSAAAAQARTAQRMGAVVEALRRQGLSGRDVQTATLSLSAQYAYAEGQAPRLTGYRASNSVTVKVRDLARLPAAVDATTQAGADEVSGIDFGLQDPQAAEDAARRDAVRRLQAQAQLYAAATGLKLARLVNLAETGGYAPQPPRPMMAMAMRAKEASTPVEAGELDVRVQVRATWELAR
ncbi:MAG: SIMPL domain-containing protein [Caulobacteraceae bacterium]|nr:SIMPL domain-containing protein [Caulobacter sp.]